MASDIVYLRDLCVSVVIGIYDWERRIRQKLYLDIDMATDIQPAAASDDIDLALNYKAISKRITEFCENSEYLLVEALAENVAALIRDEFGVSWVRLKVNKKGAVSGATDVGVVIERGERG